MFLTKIKKSRGGSKVEYCVGNAALRNGRPFFALVRHIRNTYLSTFRNWNVFFKLYYGVCGVSLPSGVYCEVKLPGGLRSGGSETFDRHFLEEGLFEMCFRLNILSVIAGKCVLKNCFREKKKPKFTPPKRELGSEKHDDGQC